MPQEIHMDYRSLLLLLGDDPLCSVRTRTAIELAKGFDAHLTGFAPTGLAELPDALVSAATLADFARETQVALANQARLAGAAFEETCELSTLGAYSAVVAETDVADGLLQQSLGHDLLVLSQADPSSPRHAAQREIVERVVLFSARPTLLLPYIGFEHPPFNNVLVAWDGSREAARAIADALPFLRTARNVNVVTWRETGLLADGAPTAQLEELAEWLLRHGVKARMHRELASAPIAEAILSRVSDLDSDLLVMGGYGHTRWTERLMGGATRGVLATMTVPVLMSR
jgi:nucleotide-binding universal stress UspA family protein